ncbi:MAG: radical SAM protein [Eubacteriales bacterium]|jgi:MoaA/NifB/PqqE/SkfB family radical SAM enzyme|nr:radical SAM protein [Lachnospiraceae bacterium]MDD5860363.1 radical SAM protein [Eubacteriales bacterium]MCH4063857.1 radical SAM protein [Lachnospiraceae bacterium]MCH4103421.1 radical SAM protein [Lachnospiraceae bacterium]MCI1309369.1 radical SAM protein [Lachnospiraceae bacterium]
MANKLVHAAERKAFELVLDTAGKKAVKNREQGYVDVVNAIQKLLGDAWPPEAYDRLRATFSKEGKWTKFFNDLIDRVDLDYLKGLFMSFGFEAGFTGFQETRKSAKKYGCGIPWVILFDPTSACNLHCTGCWASEYSRQLNLTYEQMDKMVTEAKELGIHGFVLTGGEPTVRKKDIFKLAQKHNDCGFMLFTNGTLVDQEFCDEMKKSKNIVLSMSIEGKEEATDNRRGQGVFQKVMDTMDLLRKNGLVYGVSICYTHQNYKAVTSDDFLDFLIDKGVAFAWYFHFMPVGMDATPELMPTPEEREYMYHRIREVRGYEGGKPIFCMDFQNDGEFVSGCIAGGKYYCHINPNGDVEPCVFIHYSSANIKEKSLLECLQQPLFKAYQANQPFNENLLRPCPMLENPEKLQAMVAATGAKSTDMTEPETAEHLCSKCENYAKEWAPYADKLWKSTHPDYQIKTNA